MKVYYDNNIPDIKIIELFDNKDVRGEFVKLFNEEFYLGETILFPIKEIYYSVSSKNVIRRMHFQLPPFEHEKIVHLITGKIVDVLVDLRKGSCTYGKYIVIELTGPDKKAIYIPKGFAHGFMSLEDNTIMQYCVGTVYNRECDSGIRYDSFGYDWNGNTDPIVSDRDLSFDRLDDFKSPFILGVSDEKE